MSAPPHDEHLHDEHLRPPLAWWIGVVLFGGTWGWIVLVIGSEVAAGATAAAVAALTGAALYRFGSLRVSVDEELHAGRARLDAAHTGEVRVLDHVAYRHTMGPGADARALLVTRPWIDRGVLVTVDDPHDPTPYWVVGSRDPQALAAAVDAMRQTGRTNDTV